MQLFNITNLHL